jgi:hypothetical protein
MSRQEDVLTPARFRADMTLPSPVIASGGVSFCLLKGWYARALYALTPHGRNLTPAASHFGARFTAGMSISNGAACNFSTRRYDVAFGMFMALSGFHASIDGFAEP